MSVRDDAVAMIRRICPPHLSADEYGQILAEKFDAYRREVLLKALGRLRSIPIQCTALTGPVWYGSGWNDCLTQLEDIADYQTPDNEAYHGELELLRAFALNIRAATRRGDMTFVQHLVNQHRQADKEARQRQQSHTS